MVSIIVPFFNEEKSISDFFNSLYTTINKLHKYQFEIICINDGSTDNTLSLLKNEFNYHKNINILSFSKNYGHEAAINAGINNCSGDVAIIMDADLQDPPELIPSLLKKYEKGYDVVNVKRISRNNDSFFKRITAKLFYKMMRRLAYKIKIEENVNNFRLISKRVITVIKNLTEKNKIFRFEIPFAGFKTTYVEMVRPKRIGGTSHYDLKSMNKLAIDSIISVSTYPLHLVTNVFIVLFILFCTSGITELVLFLIQVNNDTFSISNASYLVWLIINIVLLLSNIIMFSLAIIAQYIARIHLETQNRPIYVIEEVIKNK